MNDKQGILNDKLVGLRQEVISACNNCSPARNPNEVKILAVTKKKGLKDIESAYNCGVRDFGENYVQEAQSKIAELPFAAECNWHLIGNLQSNKIKVAAKLFDWIHTIDRIKTIEKLGQSRIALGKKNMLACIQVNLGNEESKSGIAPNDLTPLLSASKNINGITIKGLMCIPEANLDSAGKRQRFNELKDLLYNFKDQYPEFDTLSMGMSADYKEAIYAGANIIRIGSLLFGERT